MACWIATLKKRPVDTRRDTDAYTPASVADRIPATTMTSIRWMMTWQIRATDRGPVYRQNSLPNGP